ncbi:alpha/beta fold hydrolase [Nonomuraea sp. NPDC048826]|uniref:alpha/beta fold hydrolase n=1 Tax=Nonomuraea sp. NPDC048826 TaxID=3364347 RepID=UPI00370FC132
MERRLCVLAASAFIGAAVLSSAWVTGQLTTPRVDRAHGYIGELAARDQPWTRLFRTGDVLAGLACLTGVALAPRVREEWPGWLALAAAGLFTALAGLFPMDCAVLSDPACVPASLAHRAHVAAAVPAAVAVPVAMVVLSVRWRAPAAWLLTGLTAVAGTVTLTASAAGQLAGLAQRGLAAMIALWLVYVAVRLLESDVTVLIPGPLHVVRQGSGPAVLIACGPGGAWCHWDAVAAELARDRLVIRFDRPGLGLSPASPVPPTLHGEAARLAALAPEHPERVTVVAHAVAAWHAEAFARLHPLRVAGLVLVDPPCPPPPGRGTSSIGRALGAWLPALGGTWGAAALARLTGPLAHRLIAGCADTHRIYRGGRMPATIAGEWLARRDMAGELRDIRAEHRLPAVPVTVIRTRRRGGCPERLAAELGARLVHLPAYGRAYGPGPGLRLLPQALRAIADAV